MTRTIRRTIRKIFTAGTPEQHLPAETSTEHGTLPQRLTPGRIRVATFPLTRRGYDPYVVDEFLHRIADEMTNLQQAVTLAHAEADRIRTHLRKWQSDHAATCRTGNLSNPRANRTTNVPTRRKTTPAQPAAQSPTPATWITQPPYQSTHSQ